MYGLALGLYCGRVIAELAPRPASATVALSVTAGLIFASSLVAAAARKRGLDLWSLLPLYLYVLWPWPNPTVALAIAFVVGVAVIRANMRLSFTSLADAALLATALAVYIHTLAPTILPADSGEFQFVSYVLGIAHPPGYPLYIMLAKLFTCLPFGDVAYRVNLFSAVTSAVALVVLSRAVRRVTGSAMAGWIAAAALGATPTFWAQSTTANIRSMTALFTALQVDALVAYAQSKKPRYLLVFALAFGLGITHHGSTALLAVPFGAFLYLSDPGLLRKPRALLRPTVAFLLSLLVLLYLPLRSAMGAPFDPQPIRTFSGFLDHVLARGFRGDMFYFAQPEVLPSRLSVLFNILTFEFGPVLLLFGVAGAAFLCVRRGRLLLLFGGIFAVNALTAIAYRAPQTVEYMMPAHVALASLCAYGAWSLSKVFRARTLESLALSAALLVPALLLLRNYPSFHDLSQDRSAREYAEGVLSQAPQGARVLSNWHYATPFWYLQYVEGVRPDVEVVYVFPEGATPNAQVWLRRIAESSMERPTVVTNAYAEFGASPYQFEPFVGGWLVQAGPVYQIPAGVEPLDEVFDGRIRLVGYELDSQDVTPASSVTVRVYWQPVVKLDRDYSFFVHLVDAGGAVLGQGDVTHQAARYEVGQVILDEYYIPLLPTVQSGWYNLIAGVYITLPEDGWRRLATEDGSDSVVVKEVEVRPLPVGPVTLHPLYRPFACGYTLLGVDYDRSVPEQLRVYLHWRCDRQTQEYSAALGAKGIGPVSTRLPSAQAGDYFTTAHDLLPNASDLSVELRAVADDTRSELLGPWRIPVGHHVALPAPSASDRYICFGGQMILTKAEYLAGLSANSRLRTKMTFVAMKPITRDYTVSVSLYGETGVWQTQHDGTPALGAIPTLKWIRGVTIWDEHNLHVPPDAGGRGVLRLAVYDAFTMKLLPVLDERLARMGQGTQFELGTIEAR